MMNSWIRYGILAAASFASSAAFGNAFSGPNPDTQNLTWSGFSNGSVGVSVSTDGGTTSSGVNAGQFYGLFDGEGNGLSADDFFRFFCVDLSHFAGGTSSYTRTLGVPDATDAAQLTRLFNQYYPNPGTGTYYSGGAPTDFGDFANADLSAAFQLAVWEIWFDTGTDLRLDTGSFRATGPSAVITQAQNELDFVHTSSGTPGGWQLFEFVSNNGSQNYISVEHSGPLQQAPEPGMLLLISVGALAAWGTSKRYRKTA
jgi:hypothetical protein